MMRTERFDLLILGGGSGGYASARTARAFGASVAIVDPGPLGGLCILQGCMPSKALLASADAVARVRDAHKLGVQADLPRPDVPAIIARKRQLIDEFAAYRRAGLASFPIFSGLAQFQDATHIRVNDDVLIETPRTIIATGSRIAVPPMPGLAEYGYLTSDDILDAAQLPPSMLVLGGGYVACELGQYLHRVGVRTQMFFRAAHALSSEDEDIGIALTAALRADGLTITANAQLERIERAANGKKVLVYRLDGTEQRAEADEIALFLGRTPNIEGLNLDAIGVRAHAMAGIEVNAKLETSQAGIYAVGDVNGLHPLVHVAIAQGEIAARNALRAGTAPEEIDYRLLAARTIFTEPQVAVAGATEKDLRKHGVAYEVARYPFADHGKSMTLARTEGFVKMMADPVSGKILGASVVGPEASELIHEILVALRYNATVHEFIAIPHLHPTLAEIWTYPAEELAERIPVAAPIGTRA